VTIRKKKSLNVAKWLAVAEAAESLKFKKWKRVPEKTKKSKLIGQDSTKEKTHFTASHLAIVWGLSVDTIRDLFENEQGVEKLGNPDRKYKRQYASLRIPSDVAERVHRKLTALESRRR
jgi:hypothetical protein